MITAQDIKNWLETPQILQNINLDKLQQLSEQYPYFNIGLLLHQLKSTGNLSDIQLITNINPVFQSILTAQYHDSYNPINYTKTTILLDNDSIKETETSLEITSEPELINQTLVDETIIEDQDTANALAANNEIENISTEEEIKLKMPIFIDEEISLDELYKQEAPIMDYFASEGLKIDYEMPEDISSLKKEKITMLNWSDENKPMVVMSFSEWLTFITKKKAKEQAEIESKSALRALWQKEKLAQAIEEESEEIPEEVFEMAVNSIAQQDEIVNETMADIYARQNKIEKAIDMYKKLSLQHPEKNAYFAEKIASLQKDI